MGGSIKTCLLLCISLGISIFGFTQSVFNIAFDENGTTNSTPNSLEVGDHYYFVQKNYRNNKVFLEVMKLNQQGQEEKKEVIASHSTLNIFYGFSGSLQYLSSNEFCQLYHIALDSAVQLVFFDTNFNVKRTVRYDFNYFLNPGIVKQINDSTLLTLGRVQNASTFDLFLINTDLQGNERWRTIFGEPGKSDYGFAIEYFNDKVLVSGNTQNVGPHLFEINGMGTVDFDTIYSNYDFGRVIKYNSTYGLYFLVDKVNLGVGHSHPVLLKLDSGYNISWAKEYFTQETFTYLQQVNINDQGTLSFAGGFDQGNLLTGLFFQTNHLGDSLGSKLLEHIPGERAQFHDVRPTSDGGYILAGDAYTPGMDSWIVKVNAWGCDNVPCIVSVNEPEISKGELKCYPNPTNGSGTILGSLSSVNGESNIKVFNSIGQLIQTIPITQKDFEFQISLPSKGLYLVVIMQNGLVIQQQKWVVQ